MATNRAHRSSVSLSFALLSCGVFAGCPEKPPVVPDDIFGPLGTVLPSATAEQRATFERGQAIARRRFTPATGLGPTYNVVSCVSCHERPVLGGGGARYRNFLLVGQRLMDGSFTSTGVNGVQDHYSLATGRNADDSTTNVRATRTPIPFFGAGLIAEIPDEEILRRADPNDRDGDGVSGRPNYDRGFVGRFGRKSQTVSIEGFIRGPLFNHAGITSDPLPQRLKARLPVPSGICGLLDGGTSVECQASAPDEPTRDMDGVADPELAQQDLFDLVSFVMLTAAPKPDAPTTETQRGRALFEQARCDACHTPTLRSPRGLIPLFSDLLVHDMGAALADGIPMKDASGSEFRTQPLWGVAAGGPFLHDGRADTLHDAIEMHGGEAQASRDRYMALSTEDRGRVIAFLRSLGGADQHSDGLLPPNAPIPAVGEYGGPARALDAEGMARFERGRRLFDRDMFYAGGLGPRFNGDACRSCHFDPVIGGAGPSDVDVTRQGIIDMSTMTFTAPMGGTMAHRHGAVDARPPIDARSNYFELRQTPSVLGLGLLEAVDDATITAREDPMDANGDGIRGRAFRLMDGRIGRLGWKCNVPTVVDFVRDALSNELGITVPMQAGESFGNASDSDSVADPEISSESVADLAFYIANLAPPPRTRTMPELEDQGEAVFTRVGCAACHTPQLTTREGSTIRPFTDLLLHNVALPGRAGIAEGAAGIHDFRTAPLWGLATSAPYMHDGSAATVEASIAAHGGEAQASVTAVSALNAADRDALYAFLRSL